MLSNLVTKLVIFVLRHKRLSIEDHGLLTTSILNKLSALPLRDMICTDDNGRLVVNGKVVTMEAAQALRESARSAQTNFALNFVHEQVLYTAVVHGVHKLEKPEQSFFSRAAIWYAEEEKKYLKALAGVDKSELDAS